MNREVFPGDVLIEQVQGLVPALTGHLLTDQHVEQVVGDLLQVLLGVCGGEIRDKERGSGSLRYLGSGMKEASRRTPTASWLVEFPGRV